MLPPNVIETRRDYIEGAAAAARRTRFVVMIAMIASALVFISSWNTLKSGWMHSRIKMTQRVLIWESWQWAEDGSEALTRLSPVEKERLDQLWRGVGTDELRKAADYARFRHITTKDDAKDLLAELREMQVDRIWTVTVPVFGIQFDVNDLGFIGGFALMVTLMWLRFSLFRELESIRSMFVFARSVAKATSTGPTPDDQPTDSSAPRESTDADLQAEMEKAYRRCLRESYELISMRQVLTIPPLRGPNASEF